MGLELSQDLNREMKSQVICPESTTSFGYSGWLCGGAVEVEILVNASTGETISTSEKDSCQFIRKIWAAESYVKTLDPLECLNLYSQQFSNRSDLIMIADYDYLSQQDTRTANTSNALLFAKQLRIAMEFGFWSNYDWRCGTTNSFDCKSSTIVGLQGQTDNLRPSLGPLAKRPFDYQGLEYPRMAHCSMPLCRVPRSRS